MKKILFICFIMVTLITIGIYYYFNFRKPIDYNDLYDYSRANEFAENQLLKFINNNFSDYEILNIERFVNFGPIYSQKSKIKFEELHGIVFILYELNIISVNDNSKIFHYGIVMEDNKGILSLIDNGTHIENISDLWRYTIDIF